jgi:hypothetical protein
MAALSGVEEAAGGPVYSSAAEEASCSSTVLSAELSRILSHISDPIIVAASALLSGSTEIVSPSPKVCSIMRAVSSLGASGFVLLFSAAITGGVEGSVVLKSILVVEC